jgi:hypothetical protein
MKNQFFEWLKNNLIKYSFLIADFVNKKNTCVIAKLVTDDDGDQFVQYITHISDKGIGYGYAYELLEGRFYDSASQALKDLQKCRFLHDSRNWGIFKVSKSNKNSIKEVLLRNLVEEED